MFLIAGSADGPSAQRAEHAHPHAIESGQNNGWLTERVAGQIHVRAARSLRTGHPRSQPSLQIGLKFESLLFRQQWRPKISDLLNSLAHVVDAKILDGYAAFDLFPIHRR